MSLRDVTGKLSFGSGADVPEGMVPADKAAEQARKQAAPPAAPAPQDAELVARRDRLTEQFTLQQAELGGIFYEMAIRDHIRLDVLTQKAAALQRVDHELADVERQLRGDDGPVAGTCPGCGARHGVEARFCSRCGYVLQLAAPAAEAPEAQPTVAQPPVPPAATVELPLANGHAPANGNGHGGPPA